MGKQVDKVYQQKEASIKERYNTLEDTLKS